MTELYYSWYSICSEKVLMCLFELDLPFTGHHVDLVEFAQVDPAYMDINPDGIVPTLIDGGQRIFESTIICEYLHDRTARSPLMGRTPMERAEIRYMVQQNQDFAYPALAVLSQPAFLAPAMKRRWTAAELEALIARKRNKEKRARQLRAVREGLTADECADAEARLAQVLDRMEAKLSDGREWLCGDFSMADIGAAPNAYRCELIGRADLVTTRPALAAWYTRVSTRACFARTYAYSPNVRQPATAT